MDMVIVGFARIVKLAFELYFYVVIARAVLSWVNPDPYNPIVRFLHNLTDPVLYRLRRLMPFLQAGTFDFSPIVLLILLSVVQQVIVGVLLQLAH